MTFMTLGGDADKTFLRKMGLLKQMTAAWRLSSVFL